MAHTARKPVESVDEHHVERALPRAVHQPIELGAVVACAAQAVIDELRGDLELSPRGVLAEHVELHLWALPRQRRDPGVDRRARHDPSSSATRHARQRDRSLSAPPGTYVAHNVHDQSEGKPARAKPVFLMNLGNEADLDPAMVNGIVGVLQRYVSERMAKEGGGASKLEAAQAVAEELGPKAGSTLGRVLSPYASECGRYGSP